MANPEVKQLMSDDGETPATINNKIASDKDGTERYVTPVALMVLVAKGLGFATPAALQTALGGLQLKSPNGTAYHLSVNDDGQLSAEKVSDGNDG